MMRLAFPARILLDGLTIVLLLVCACLIVIGIDSRRNSYMVVRYAPNPNPKVWTSDTLSLQIVDYRVSFTRYRASFDHAETVALYRESSLQENGPRGVQWSRRADTAGGWPTEEDSGFGHVGAAVSNLWPGGPIVGRWDRYSAPIGILILIPAVLPVLRVSLVARRWWYRDRHQNGRCRVCGYDLRATPDRCPECGAAAETSE